MKRIIHWEDIIMKNTELYKLLEIPNEVVNRLNQYQSERNICVPDSLVGRILVRSEWDAAVKELQGLVGDDPDGIKILWELLNIVCRYSHSEYVKMGISMDVFVDTMKYVTRFLNEHYDTYGCYRFVWAWWFPREISLSEYRIGALEYELVDGYEREIAVHIPSDADFSPESVDSSLESFHRFRDTYYPDWKDVKFTCDSWLMVPELKELLGEGSNIIAFQNRFVIDSIDREATWFLGWVYPGAGEDYEALPEKTTLQRNMKRYLLSGRKFGVAKGHIKI
jgi:hypothetical protein